ncbi:minor tail protein [Arthrobacter phage Abba]|uniref:Minor tail protein n=1 Tax=Arthrobacter phage Abba TaxID=2713256 RepID=A0A6G8R2F8_9CAUD|nr:minor tail protein [Arthrobacter phage Abba]QIN94351.1 minor tail protein [Arthrobacter phage Abba]
MSAVAEALRKKPTSGAVSISELWRGQVAEVFADGTAQVIVPHLSGDEPVGRIESLVPNLAIGARVIVGAIEGRRDDLVVLSALGADGTVVAAGRFTDVTIDNPPTLAGHAVRKDYADALGSITSVANTIVRRGASGSIIVQDAYLGGVQTAGNAATTKTYVDAQIGTRAASVHSHAYSSLTGIPASFAPSAHQHPMTDLTGVLTPAQLPAATGAAAGSMSAADKVKLDAATSAATASTTMMRDAANTTAVGVALLTAAQSTDVRAATRKDYVDTQVATRAALSHAHTYADISGTVPTSALPPLAVNDVFTVADQASMLALVAQRGDMAIRTDTGKSYALSTDNPGTLADWKELMAAGQVVSVAGKTGVVSLVKADVGLGNVDNTTDLLKPISTATQTALNGKAASSHTHAATDLLAGALTMSTLRLTGTGDASASSTAHAFQIGPDSGANLIIDNNEIMARNNGVGVETYFEAGVTSGIAPAGAGSLTRKDYVDARTPNLTDSGSVIIALATNDYFKTVAITFSTPFTAPPKMSATITSNVAGRAAQLNAYAYAATTTGCTLKIMTNDVAAIGTSYNISVDWVAVGS